MADQATKSGVAERLSELAAKDDSFREELKSDPSGALSKLFGGRLPDDINIHVHEEDPKNVHIVIPGKPALPEDAASMPHDWCSSEGHSWSSCGYELTCYGPTCSSS
jgi:hypothetical protein